MTNYIFKKENHQYLEVGKIICLARTYKKHAKEMKSKVPKEPLLFLKPSSSVIFDNQNIKKPEMSECLHHEIELGIVISKKCKNISRKHALDYVLGYCVCIDVTARDIQTIAKKNGWPWSISKGFDTFAPIGNIILKDDFINPNDCDLLLKVNGEIRQNSNTKNMVFTIQEIISFISKIMTLERGDLIMTGTPEGVSEIKKDDMIEAYLNGSCEIKTYVE